LSATAVRVDPKFKSWAYASNTPTVFDAYRELRAGIDAFTKGELADAAAHFTKSAGLDTLSPTPIVWAAFARAFYFDAAADSILRGLSASQRRLGPWDAAMLAFLKAFRQGDLTLAHTMAHRVATTVPNSEWRLIVATSALNAGRPKETLDVLHTLEPGAGWTEGWVFYWTTIGRARHWLGQYEEELSNDRGAQRSLQYNTLILVQAEVKALAALGRVSELTHRLDEIEAERQRGYWAPFDVLGQAAVEVRAHLGVAAARPFYDRIISQERSHRDSLMALSTIALTAQDIRIAIADDLASAGRLDEARALLDSVMAHRKLPELGALMVDAEIAALAGDADRAHRALAQVGQRRYADAPAASGPTVGQVSTDSEIADIYALLGEKDAAVGLYARAIGNGMAFRDGIHLNLGTNRLRGYPPFEALVKPIDTPETR
jgi:tetratricopeptide (TPR) repeat protein